MTKKSYLVAVNTPFNNSILTYESETTFCKGDLVEVPLGKRVAKGCVLREISELKDSTIKLKKILGMYDETINLKKDIDFYQWMAKYYHYPVGQLVFDILPKMLKRPRELKIENGNANVESISLEPEQEKVWKELDKLDINIFSKHLVHGVTGSGKSYIYLKFIKKILDSEKTVLFLVPEINLTPQFISFFREHLSVPIFLYHSEISNSEKYNLWKYMAQKDGPALLIGVRSSLFIPFKNLGCIVVDEEHDGSFKQDDRCTYNARDISLKKGQVLQIPIILGSATPSIETYYNFKRSKNYLPLKKRFSKGALPLISLIDLREADYGDDFSHWPIPESTIEKVKQRIDKGEQIIFFVNKLGFASYVQCRSCGHTFECPNCTVSLTMFKGRRELSCHSCTYKEPMPDICPACQNMNLLNKGFGTEKIKEVLEQIFPNKIIGRFDRDEIKTTKKMEEVLNSFHDGKTDILVGTQMISKGHNFKNVNMVVVLGIDSQMNYPDYKSSERTYQILTQISGRSGRFGKDSEVLIHTHSPENQIFSYVENNSFDGFYESEIDVRDICSCPPFFKLAVIYITGRYREQLMIYSENSTRELKSLSKKHFPKVQILGPRPSVIEKRANKFTWVVLLKSQDVNQLHNLLSSWQEALPAKSGISIKLDIDPQFVT